MKKTLIISIIAIFLMIVLMAQNSQIVYAGSLRAEVTTGFRCGNLMMKEGLEKMQVLYNCGEPLSQEKSYVDRYGGVEKLFYGPDHGYFHVLYFFVGKLFKVESIRQM